MRWKQKRIQHNMNHHDSWLLILTKISTLVTFFNNHDCMFEFELWRQVVILLLK